MMKRDELLEYVYNLNLVPAYTRQLANSSDWAQIEDITQEIWLQIWCLYNIVTQTIEVWRSEVVSNENEEEEPQQPEHHAIGFHQ